MRLYDVSYLPLPLSISQQNIVISYARTVEASTVTLSLFKLSSQAMPSDISVEKSEFETREFVDRGAGIVEEASERRRKERALVRRLDRFIMPVLMVINLISYLDRGNIGFATAVSIFYIFYILAEFPASLLAKRLRFDRVIPAIALCWVASALAGAFGGLLAWGVFHLDGVSNLAGWRWLYILEGLITVVWAGFCTFLLPQNYETAYFLSDEQKTLMRERAEEMEAYSGGSGHYTKKDIKEAAKDIKSWIHGVIQIAIVTILYGFSTFLPIIIKDGFHFSTVQAQYLVIPVNIWASIVYAFGAILSDKYMARFLPLVISAPLGIAGYAILLCDVPPGIRTWLSVNCAPDGKRAASLGIQFTLANIGGVIAGQIYQSGAGPAFTLGHAWSLGSLSFAFLGWWFTWLLYTRRQRAKDLTPAEGIMATDAVFTDRSPSFKYQL
ncbi:hypothetical protein NPX13_g1777 [Xylaria arbuscula]|uniref:Major facilitator superfamily (MFS) profile domain-containing protein n=1 Tax=Xylaria arbuscula TaxID=114810 RepID=A0A9W8TPS8_9PEZI|nr:hypothetical protein NPX13_g1777 [Xylaria arbuscula]